MTTKPRLHIIRLEDDGGERTIFKDSEDPNTDPNAWRVEFRGVQYIFSSHKTARRFADMLINGKSAAVALEEIRRGASGTAPDTSLHLGETRRQWLLKHDGIQPVINQLIDEAMRAEK